VNVQRMVSECSAADRDLDEDSRGGAGPRAE
jgi:hypothetical protein